MNQDRIVEFAKQAGISKNSHQVWHAWESEIHRFAELVRDEALEEAAKVAEDDDHIVDVPGYYAQLGDAKLTAHNIATAIRGLKK